MSKPFHAWFHLCSESDIAVSFETYSDAIAFVKQFMLNNVKDYKDVYEDVYEDLHEEVFDSDGAQESKSFTHIIGVGSLIQAMVTNCLESEKAYYGQLEIMSQDKATETLVWRLETQEYQAALDHNK